MEASEADSRFGTTALRALDDALALAAREPRVALTQARKAAEAVALHLYARDVGDPDAASKRLMLDDLLKALVKQKLIPEGVAMHFGTVQRYGNYGSHPQADDASVGNTIAFNQPCIESLRFIARWYVRDKLHLRDEDVPPNIHALALSLSTAPSAPEAPVSEATGPRLVASPSTPSNADPFGLVGACMEGKYQIESMVAEGGFGAVYRGTHLTLEKPIAVKVLKSPEGATDNARKAFFDGFALEAKTIARMDHPAIVKVLDFGVSIMPTQAPAPWMVLEWLTGVSLDDELKRRRGTPGRSPAEVLALLSPVIQAVAYAHNAGIAHRDIKPANIMLPAGHPALTATESATSPEAPTGSTTRPRAATGTFGRRGELGAKLLDFGIAKIMRDDETEASGLTRTQSTMVAFSLPYAAPEQISGTRTGPWTDVHALALIVVELLVNRAPYTANDAQEMYMAVLSPVRPTPARFGVDVGVWEPVLARALTPKPTERYATAGELLDALEAEVPSAARPMAAGAMPVAAGPAMFPATMAMPAGETFRGAEVPVRPAQSASRGRMFGAALAGLLVVGGGIGYVTLGGGEPYPAAAPAPTATVRAVRAAPPAQAPAPSAQAPAPTAQAPAAPAPLVAPAPTADGPTTPNTAAAAPAAEADTDDDTPTGRGHRRSRHGRRSRSSHEVVTLPTAVGAPAARPGRIHAD